MEQYCTLFCMIHFVNWGNTSNLSCQGGNTSSLSCHGGSTSSLSFQGGNTSSLSCQRGNTSQLTGNSILSGRKHLQPVLSGRKHLQPVLSESKHLTADWELDCNFPLIVFLHNVEFHLVFFILSSGKLDYVTFSCVIWHNIVLYFVWSIL